MTSELYARNWPGAFWRLLLDPSPSDGAWQDAARLAGGILPPAARRDGEDLAALLANTLGEGQFGLTHWRISPAKRAYYALKPVLPRFATRRLRRLHSNHARTQAGLEWPIESRYARFQWSLAGHLLRRLGLSSAPFIHFWPHGYRSAFVLTHDIETAQGQAFAARVAELEERLGFRSSFNFVPERYPLDYGLIRSLRSGGFEIGIHGLKHDGKLFNSRRKFMERAVRINSHLTDLGAAGFRAPLTHRQPEWMQALDIEYDLSFFDTDPFEPVPGGVMSIWPFTVGHFVELPYTLVQDFTLVQVLDQRSPALWLEKVDFIESFCGMALLNTHPDYLRAGLNWSIYEEFLLAMRARASSHWHAQPLEVARWWLARSKAASTEDLPDGRVFRIATDDPDSAGRVNLDDRASTMGTA